MGFENQTPETIEEQPAPTRSLSEADNPFALRKTIEQRPFRDLGVQQFFRRWCQANDGIEPVYISREEWQEKYEEQALVPAQEKGKFNLYIPNDLQLWEMVGIMESIDRNTYAQKPERRDEKKAELEKLAATFKNAGIYIAQRADGIAQGKEIAEALAEELYAYGESLAAGQAPSGQPAHEGVRQGSLTPEELRETDMWLAGEDLYASRMQRAKDEGGVEELRVRTLRQFFRVAEKAMQLQRQHADETDRPFSPLHEAFLNKVRAKLELQVEKPRTEMMSAIFRRGLEKLFNEMNDPEGTKDWRTAMDRMFKRWGYDFALGERTLKESLNVEGMKHELQEARATGDAKAISDKERELALRVQSGVSRLQYAVVDGEMTKTSNPADIVALQKVNCVGFTTVGAALQREVGLKVLIVSQPGHSSSFLVTADGRVFTEEMQGGGLEEILNGEISGTLENGRTVTVADLVRLSEGRGETQRIEIEATSPKVQKVYSFVYKPEKDKEPPKYGMTVYHPDVGLQISILRNLQNALSSKAIGAELSYEQQETWAKFHRGEGPAPSNDNLYAASSDARRQMQRIAKNQYQPFVGEPGKRRKGHDVGNFEEDDFLKRAVSGRMRALSEQLVNAQDLRGKGHIEEALDLFRQFAAAADPVRDADAIQQVKKYITELEASLQQSQ